MNLRQNKRILFLGTIGLFLSCIFFSIVVLMTRSTPTLSEINDPEKQAFLSVPVEEKVSEEELKELPGFKEKQSAADRTQFTYSSPNISQDNLVITDKNNVVIYKRYVSVTNTFEHPRISEYLKKYGTPEKEATGSNKYGPFAKTYMYGSKGIAFVGNPFTDEIEEIHIFSPMSVSEFISKYGQDINENMKPIEERGN